MEDCRELSECGAAVFTLSLWERARVRAPDRTNAS